MENWQPQVDNVKSAPVWHQEMILPWISLPWISQ